MVKVSQKEYDDANKEVICWCGETCPYRQAKCFMKGCGLSVESDEREGQD